jgi:hypothetical protein
MLFPLQASAQWSFGASYEMREQAPENGFGVRLERDLLGNLPLVDVGLRAHFSFFNEENEFSTDGGPTVSGDFTFYDYGLAATGGVSLGLFKPYVGLGIGNDNIEFVGDTDDNDFDESEIFWNGFVGAELTIIPKLHPFVEYRFEPSDSFDDINADFDSDGRLILGLLVSF